MAIGMGTDTGTLEGEAVFFGEDPEAELKVGLAPVPFDFGWLDNDTADPLLGCGSVGLTTRPDGTGTVGPRALPFGRKYVWVAEDIELTTPSCEGETETEIGGCEDTTTPDDAVVTSRLIPGAVLGSSLATSVVGLNESEAKGTISYRENG